MMDNEQLPKGYKNTEVGVIPEDWGIGSIKDLALIKTGSRNTQDKIEGGEYPFFVRSQIVERINSYSYDGEAVLTAGDGVGVGKVMHYINGKFDCHQRVYRISDFNKKISGYYFYLYFSNNFLNRIMQMTAKSSVDSVRMDMIANMQIPLPPTKSEQTAIATALSDADALINSLEKLIAKKRNIKQGAMQHLLKPQEGWEVKKLGNIGKPYGGLSGKSKLDFADGKFPYIPFMNIMSNPIIDTSYVDYVNIGVDENQNKALKGDLFFNGSSETPEEVGMCSVLLEDIPNLYLNSFCFGFRLNKDSKENGLYLSYYFRSSEGRKLFYSMAQGATRYNLSKSNFNKMEVSLPQPEQQNEIATILSDMDAEIQALETKLEKYRKIKLGMMQNLLTGKIRLV
ncbi:MAG: restriction endonuclease subunit S [Rikenellaceae bacterium]|nr:restriction endonuclease subunit S [Rikenellaceae bacterium]